MGCGQLAVRWAAACWWARLAHFKLTAPSGWMAGSRLIGCRLPAAPARTASLVQTAGSRRTAACRCSSQRCKLPCPHAQPCCRQLTAEELRGAALLVVRSFAGSPEAVKLEEAT